MDTVLTKETTSIFRTPPEDANSNLLWNTATQTTSFPNLHHIMCIHHCVTPKQKNSGWFMEEKVNYSTTLCSDQVVHDVCCCTVHCSELRFVLPVKWNKKVNGYNKTKNSKPFWNAKCFEFYTYGSFHCQHNYPKYMQLPKQKWNKYHNYIYRCTWQILTATVLYSKQDFHKVIGEYTVIWILRST